MRGTSQPLAGNRVLLVALSIVALLGLAQVASVGAHDVVGTPAAPADRPAGDGQARDVDAELIRRLILEGRLSDREAEHYRRLEPAQPQR